jgi:RNA polymerase subunit RPABC4/transcription elongation factor Spt4
MTPFLFAADITTTTDDGLFDGVGDFFNSGTWLVIRNLAIFFAAVFWLASAYWVYKDARRRVQDPWLVAMATLLGLVPPFVGPLVYLFFRPPEYLDDVRERELEIRAMEERLGSRDAHCPVCRAAVEPDFLICPVCTTKLKQACATCKAPLEPLWQVCPYCETPIVRQSSVFDETIAVSAEQLREPLRTPRRARRSGWEEDTAENLEDDQ